MNTWFIADEHYFHEKIIAYCKRPFANTKEMQHEIIERHNTLVEPEDVVWHLGDFALTDNWKQIRPILNKLNGNHHLVIGNHDWLYIWYYIEAGFQSVHTTYKFDDLILVHDPSIACSKLENVNFIHGHLHNLGLSIAPNCFSVSVEMHSYYPVNIETIKEHFNGKK